MDTLTAEQFRELTSKGIISVGKKGRLKMLDTIPEFQKQIVNPILNKTKPEKRSKYGAKKVNGYDSTKEAKRAEVLKLMQKQGIISDLQEQVTYELLPKQEIMGFGGKMICGRRAMNYIADFVYIQDGVKIVEDVKGFRLQAYKQKARLMKRIYGIIIKET